MSNPKDLDGIKSAKIDLKLSLRALKSFTESVESFLDLDNDRDAAQQASALAQHASLIVDATARWRALAMVREGIYKDPREEEQE